VSGTYLRREVVQYSTGWQLWALIASDLKVYGTALFGVYIAEACIIKADAQ
jgi:hypothetical protein